MSGPLSLSGTELDGDSLVRFVYVDESGISANESLLVVAGVIIDADSQWIPVQRHIGGLIDKHISIEDREGFAFHAKDLFHGGGKVFGNRDKYPLDRSREILKELLAIPAKFHLPVVVGFTRKENQSPTQSKKIRREILSLDHGIAFSLCAVGAELFMRNHANPTEIAQITAEDNTETKKIVKLMHDALRGVHPQFAEYVKNRERDLKLGPDFFPFRRLVDSVHFVEKSGAILLQLADICAFVTRCYLEEKPKVEEFVRAFTQRGPESIASLEKVRANHAGALAIRCWG